MTEQASETREKLANLLNKARVLYGQLANGLAGLLTILIMRTYIILNKLLLKKEQQYLETTPENKTILFATLTPIFSKQRDLAEETTARQKTN
jgi:hypothetical protein